MPDRRIVAPNDLGDPWMAFTASRQLKTSPRLLTSDLDELRSIHLTGNNTAPSLPPLALPLLIEERVDGVAHATSELEWNGPLPQNRLARFVYRLT